MSINIVYRPEYVRNFVKEKYASTSRIRTCVPSFFFHFYSIFFRYCSPNFRFLPYFAYFFSPLSYFHLLKIFPLLFFNLFLSLSSSSFFFPFHLTIFLQSFSFSVFSFIPLLSLLFFVHFLFLKKNSFLSFHT